VSTSKTVGSDNKAVNPQGLDNQPKNPKRMNNTNNEHTSFFTQQQYQDFQKIMTLRARFIREIKPLIIRRISQRIRSENTNVSTVII
jgi:hypothetical protein